MTGRAVRVLLVGLQLLGAFVPLADALLEAGAAAAVVHVEQPTSESCLPVHLHEACALCQHVSQQAVTAAGAPSTAPLGEQCAARIAPPDDLPARPAPRFERGRSPPLA